MIRVDSHFHPNFNFLLPQHSLQKHAARLWKEFVRTRLDVVFISEHAYKHPARSYEHMQRAKPAGSRTMLVPAVEALTKEGMDVIVFSRDEHVYSQRDILTPYKLTMDKLLQRICADHRLYAIIPHPFLPSNTGLINHRKREETKDCIRRAHFVEKYNSSLRPLEHFLRCTGLMRFCKKKMRRFRKTADVPGNMIDKGVLVFGGSDAHHWWDIGTHLVIHAPRPRTDSALFRALLHDKHRRTIVWNRKPIALALELGTSAVTVFLEAMRKAFGIWQLDRTVPFTRIAGGTCCGGTRRCAPAAM